MNIKKVIIENKNKLAIIFAIYLAIYVAVSFLTNSCFRMIDTTGGSISEYPSKLECFQEFILEEPTWYLIMIIGALTITPTICWLLNLITKKYKN